MNSTLNFVESTWGLVQ